MSLEGDRRADEAPAAEGPGPEGGAADAAGPGPDPVAPDGGEGPDGAPQDRNPLGQIPWYTAPAILLGIPVLAGLLAWLHRPFYENVIWQYYWGPIKADAMGAGRTGLCLDGSFGPCDVGPAAMAGYNYANTLSWVVLLAVCVLGVAQILHRFRAPMGPRLILAATLWVVSGSVWHVLQDTKLIERPLEYFFITPPIYLMFAAFGVLSFVVGHYLAYIERRSGLETALHKMWLLMGAAVLGYLALWLVQWRMLVEYVNPVWVALFTAATFFLVRSLFKAKGTVDPETFTLHMAWPGLALGLAFMARFMDNPWRLAPNDPYWNATLVSVLVAAVAAGLVYGVASWRMAAGSKHAHVFTRTPNLLLVFGQTLDGVSSAVGIDLLGYTEKHVLSGALIHGFEDFSEGIGFGFGAQYPTFIAFLPVKFALSVFIVWAMDVYAREDARRNPALMGLVKFAIIMVGIGPGVRNMLRMSLGV